MCVYIVLFTEAVRSQLCGEEKGVGGDTVSSQRSTVVARLSKAWFPFCSPTKKENWSIYEMSYWSIYVVLVNVWRRGS